MLICPTLVCALEAMTVLMVIKLCKEDCSVQFVVICRFIRAEL